MQRVRATDDTFCIAVLGDFLWKGPRLPGASEVTWEPLRATPDSVMDLAGLRPRIRASLGPDSEQEELEFRTLQDLHPDKLFRELDLFRPLRVGRERAEKGDAKGPGQDQGPRAASEVETADGERLLDAVLDATQPETARPEPGSPDDIGAFARQVVRPHLVPDQSDARARIAAVDRVASQAMSCLLHLESFQSLEAIWRSLVFLLSRIDTTGKVRVYLVHLPFEDLRSELSSSEDPLRSRLFELLSSPRLGAPGRRWAVVTGAYRFGLESEEVELLGRIARVARAADVPWISNFSPDVGQGRESPDPGSGEWMARASERWGRLRARPEASWVGVTFPRFLLREPYGASPSRKDAFDFREAVKEKGHLLWGDGAFLPVVLLAQGFVTQGWGLRPEHHLDLGGMPLAPTGEGVGAPQSSLEVSVTQADARILAERGIMPLLGFPEKAGVRVAGIHSLAGPTAPLAAWWTS